MSETESNTQLNHLWRLNFKDLPHICKYCANNLIGLSLCARCFESSRAFGFDPIVPDTPEGKLIRLLILISILKREMSGIWDSTFIQLRPKLKDKLGSLMFELESLLYAEEEKKRPFITIIPDIPLNNSWLCPICHEPVLKSHVQCSIQEGRRHQTFHGKCYSQYCRYERTLHELKLFLIL